MQIQEKHVEKYRQIYQKIYHEDINYQDAYVQCLDLVSFCNLARQPISKADLQALEKYERAGMM